MLNANYVFPLEMIYRHKKIVEGAADLLHALRMYRISFVLYTEQTGRKKEDILAALQEAGLTGIQPDELFTSTDAATAWISQNDPACREVVVLGSRALKEDISSRGYRLSYKNPSYLITGMNRSLTYDDYSEALQVVLNGARILATDNRKVQTVDSQAMIGNGAITAMLAFASGAEVISFGRGSLQLFKAIGNYLNVPADKIVMAGTSYEKDILPARKLGWTTILVTNGEGIMHLGMDDSSHPDYIVEDLFGLCK